SQGPSRDGSREPANGRMVDVHVGNPFRLVLFRNCSEYQPDTTEAGAGVEDRVLDVVVHADKVISVNDSDLAEVVADQPRALALESGVLARQVGRRVVLLRYDPFVPTT